MTVVRSDGFEGVGRLEGLSVVLADRPLSSSLIPGSSFVVPSELRESAGRLGFGGIVSVSAGRLESSTRHDRTDRDCDMSARRVAEHPHPRVAITAPGCGDPGTDTGVQQILDRLQLDASHRVCDLNG